MCGADYEGTPIQTPGGEQQEFATPSREPTPSPPPHLQLSYDVVFNIILGHNKGFVFAPNTRRATKNARVPEDPIKGLAGVPGPWALVSREPPLDPLITVHED